MNNCSCNNKKYLGEGCIELPSEFGGYFLVQNLFKELDTEEKRNIARINLGIDLNKINQINKVIPPETSETNKLVNKIELQQAILEEATTRETKYNELNNKIPFFTNNQLETLNSGITNKDKIKLNKTYNIIGAPIYVEVSPGNTFSIPNFPLFPGISILVDVLQVDGIDSGNDDINFEIEIDQDHTINEGYDIPDKRVFIVDLTSYKKIIGNVSTTKTFNITSNMNPETLEGKSVKMLVTPIYIL